MLPLYWDILLYTLPTHTHSQTHKISLYHVRKEVLIFKKDMFHIIKDVYPGLNLSILYKNLLSNKIIYCSKMNILLPIFTDQIINQPLK